jgi:DNA polymerase/3'-5' exonuclease PolX
MTLKDASQIAEEARIAIAPFCALDSQGRPLCYIAGSVRRQKMDMIKDVEIVAVPAGKYLHEMADVVNKKWGEPQIGKYPSKYTRIRGRYNLDIFFPTVDTFGLIYFIRTGPDSFCRRALSEWKKITNGGYSEDGILRDADGHKVPTPDEQAVFAALKWNFVKPENRT